MIKYEDILTSFRKGLRNGNWRKLNRLEKALYMASLWYSRVLGAIINEKLVRMLSVLVDFIISIHDYPEKVFALNDIDATLVVEADRLDRFGISAIERYKK